MIHWWARQTWAATAAAALMVGIETVGAAMRAQTSWAVTIEGAWHLFSMILPLSLGVGWLTAVGLVLARRFEASAEVASRLSSLRRMTTHDPVLFGRGTALVLGGSVYLFAAARVSHHFATRYHDAQLAAWVQAVALLALTLAIGIGTVALAPGLVRLSRFLGRAASGAGIVGLGGVWVGGGVAVAMVTFPSVLQAYSPLSLAWVPTAVVVFAVFTWIFWARYRTADRPARWMVGGAVAMAGLAIVMLAISGATYGTSSRVRTWVEQHAVSGRALVRAYASATDRDGDGHSFAFGGADCDDGNAAVYPGALDQAGDGVDADCFDGDGTHRIAAWGDGHYGRRPKGLERPNVVLFMIDALRPDHLGCFGYKRPVSPHLDDFCRQSVRFEEAIAPSSRSIRSVPAMMTGRYPSQIAYGSEYLYPSLREENHTLAEVLTSAGYRTVAVIGTNYFARAKGFFQGFSKVVQDAQYKPPRSRTVSRALAELQELQKRPDPWLLWVDLFNVHLRYLSDGRKSDFGPREVDKYDTEIRLADAEFQRFMDGLKASGQLDRTVVVVLSDHGEAFEEHGSQGHSTTLYEEEVRSTLLFRVPGMPARTVSPRVSLVDLMPTVLNLANLPLAEPAPAHSLVPLMNGRKAAKRIVYSELLPDGLFPYDQKSIYDGQDKLLWWIREGRVQLFDLARDRQERNDRSDDDPKRARELLGLLRAWVASTHRPNNRRADIIARNRLQRLPDPGHRLDADVEGFFRVEGFDLSRVRYRRGERIPVTFYYRVQQAQNRDLFFYVHLEPPPGIPPIHDFHAHHYPLNGSYRTPQRKAGELLRDPVEIVIPRDIPSPLKVKLTLSILENRRPVGIRTGDGVVSVVHLADLEIR